ncbi:GntR family transcriptional regulator [Bradyrhizobium manausense]|nr:GntR family transcriptional regulator [Bradyrhizobium manausense]MBR0834179.1 GntR family transcriptional regulator [Bradyrhizobium manausense]
MRNPINTLRGLDQMSKDKSAAKRGSKPTKRQKERPDRSASLAQQAYEAIKEKVITLYFLPGQYLNEAAISDLLKLGRTPVHQALQRLQLEGLIDVVPRKGVIIQPDSIGNIIEFLDARLVVEPEIARTAASHAAAKDVEELQAILDGNLSRIGGGEINAFVECDHAFHKKISAMSANRVLGDFALSLHERCTRAWYLNLWQTLDTSASDRQHRAILKAIRSRDGDGAANAMRAHLSNLRERVLKVLHNAPRAAGAMPLRAGSLKDPA